MVFMLDRDDPIVADLLVSVGLLALDNAET